MGSGACWNSGDGRVITRNGTEGFQARVEEVKAGHCREPGQCLADVRLKPTQAWQHQVFVGVFDLDRVHEVVAQYLEVDPDVMTAGTRGGAHWRPLSVRTVGR